MALEVQVDLEPVGGLDSWRDVAAKAVLNAMAIVGLLAAVGSAVWCYFEQEWTQLAAVGGVSGLLLPLVLVKRLPLQLRIHALLLVCYAIGVVQLFTDAPFGIAVLILLVTAAMAGLLLDTRTMLFWVAITMLTVTLFSGAVATRRIDRPMLAEVGIAWWALWTVSFALLTLAVVMPQRMLIRHVTRMAAQSSEHRKTLADSQQRTQMIFDSVSDAIFMYDINTGRIIESNEAACRMWKCSPDEITRMTLGGSCLGESPYSVVEARQWMARAVRDEPCVFEWRSRYATGELFWTEMTIRRAIIGDRARLVVTARDIDMRKRTEEALLKANRELTFQKYAVDQHAIVVMTDPAAASLTSTITSATSAATRARNCSVRITACSTRGITPRRFSRTCTPRSPAAMCGGARSATAPRPATITGWTPRSCRFPTSTATSPATWRSAPT